MTWQDDLATVRQYVDDAYPLDTALALIEARLEQADRLAEAARDYLYGELGARDDSENEAVRGHLRVALVEWDGDAA